MKISNNYAAEVIKVMLEDNEKEPWRPVYLSGLRLEALAMAVNALESVNDEQEKGGNEQ